ncbi:hypothetical protein [Allopontixanthobacter sediminis]|nr:hypothetical protein [Allopontixanthobacter sediminis]
MLENFRYGSAVLRFSFSTAISLAAMTTLATAGSAQGRDEAVTPEARTELAEYAACVARERPDEAARLLKQDFRSSGYRNGMANLSKFTEGCARDARFSKMRMGTLPFAGALAESLLEASPDPLLARLAMAALKPDVITYSRTDAMAMCMIRGAPDLVARMFASEINSAEETAATKVLTPIASLCLKEEAGFEASPLGMRSMLATASYRLLAAQES